MDIERGNLEIIFKWIPSDRITWNEIVVGKLHDCFHVNRELYLQQCSYVFSGRSEDEHNNCYEYLKETMGKKSQYKSSVFQLIIDLAEKLLTYNYGDVICKFEQLLRWREVSLPLGQDFFVCAYLAERDLRHGENRTDFTWTPIILSDNQRISRIMENGIAENHFHLKGSSRVFEVNWICLMNNICEREKEFHKMNRAFHHNENYVYNFPRRVYERCMKAALYRLYLFCTLRNRVISEDILSLINDVDMLKIYLGDVQDFIDRLKSDFGAKLEVEGKIEGLDCKYILRRYTLDYALRKELKEVNNNSYRIIAGERSLLYDCFRACFNGTFTDKQQNIFYCYLKLCVAFRQEMIQANRDVGFQNFSNYELRKEYFIENYDIYQDEFLSMAIKNQLEREYLKYLEMRITPKESSAKIFEMMNQYGKYLKRDDERRIRYVMHFPKSKDYRNDEFPLVRNFEIRRINKKRARALAAAMHENLSIMKNVVGIDACANEIGCRPETFGQIFRYLRNLNLFSTDDVNYNSTRRKQLFMTYHVGEDFLDIVDGLRAIDEALLFCGLERGSRIGHALALGVEPNDYYASKGYKLLLPKQVLMDDIAWLIYVANSSGCNMDLRLRMKLVEIFQILFEDVYRNYHKEYSEHVYKQPEMIIIDYYQGWKLRGDDPELYQLSRNEYMMKYRNRNNELEYWDRFAFNTHEDIPEMLRELPIYYWLNKIYSWDKDVRERGKQMEEFKIDANYINLVRQLQNCMINKLVKKGIAIETNPSSNYLIGTIRRYDEHPILRFNSRKLAKTDTNMSLSVSLNTDDQGVFDTLLENEYALMALALEKTKDENGKNKYDIEDIYEWLDYVRKMGLEQVFPK